MTLHIDKYELYAPVILAPMSGVTDKPFRKMVRKFGAPLLVTEMIASRAMIVQSKQSMQKCTFDQEGGLTSVQLAGCEPEVVAEAAKMNEDLGAKIIDLNFGCPAKKVVNSYSGSALMRDEKKAMEIMEATVKAVGIPVTLKMRMGWDHGSLNAPTLARMAQEVGIKMLTIHGRTRCQFYSGTADWEFIKQVKEVVAIPVVVNGDIKNAQDAANALQLSTADGVMIGRGAYGKPWLIQQMADYLEYGTPIIEPELAVKRETLLEHYEEMLSYYGIELGMMMARKHISWYSAGIPGSAEFRSYINNSTDHQQVSKRIVSFFS